MSEDERKSEIQNQCWKTIFIAIALLAIGAVLGHLATVRCYQMMGRYGGGYGMRTCWDKGRMVGKCEFGRRFGGGKKVCDKQGDWVGCKEKMGKGKPGRTYPKCSEKTVSPEQKKAVCPMVEKKADESKKD